MWQSIWTIRKRNKNIRNYKKSIEYLETKRYIREAEDFKIALNNLKMEAEVCGYCNIELEDNDIINNSHKYENNCRFCFSKI